MARKIVLHNAALNADSEVPNKPALLRVLAQSGWHPKTEKAAARRVSRPTRSDSDEVSLEEPQEDKEQ